jgi:hypothetical protein
MSTVIGEVGPNLRLGASATLTTAPTPSKLNAWPTLPAANVAPFCSVPLLPSALSNAFLSARHQLTKPEGDGTHATAVAISCARKTHGAQIAKRMPKMTISGLIRGAVRTIMHMLVPLLLNRFNGGALHCDKMVIRVFRVQANVALINLNKQTNSWKIFSMLGHRMAEALPTLVTTIIYSPMYMQLDRENCFASLRLSEPSNWRISEYAIKFNQTRQRFAG